MLVIPAIDIRGGRCVRLRQGDYSQETVYDDDPVAVARRWANSGARLIHVVDLDGAAGAGPQNLDVILRIARSVEVPIQMGGGLKSRLDVDAALASGVERVVLGTAAVTNKALLSEVVAAYGNRIVVGIDARDGKVAVRGWRELSSVRALDLAREIELLGVARLIYTDIARDGMLTEPNYVSLEELVATVAIPIIASGGVANIQQLKRLRSIGAEGAIVGRALYTGDVELVAALRAMEEDEGTSRVD